MSPTAEPIHDATVTFTECSRWRAIPDAIHTRLLHAEFLTLSVDTQEDITDLLRVRSREAGITAEYRTRWHHLGGIAALFGLAAFLLCLSTVL